jgi:hypothetical protein
MVFNFFRSGISIYVTTESKHMKQCVGCTNRIKRLSAGINDWILTEDLSANK